MNTNFRAVSLDIDGTLVRGKAELTADGFETWFRDWLTCHNIAHTHPYWQAILDGTAVEEVVKTAGLPLAPFLEGLKDWAASTHEGIEGAASMMQAAASAGREVHLASTNSSTIAIAKIAGAGLHTALLAGTRGGNEVAPEGKTSPDFYRRLSEWIEIPPERIVHIGDDATADARYALEAGVGFCLLIQPLGTTLEADLLGHPRLSICHTPHDAARWLQQLDQTASRP